MRMIWYGHQIENHQSKIGWSSESEESAESNPQVMLDPHPPFCISGVKNSLGVFGFTFAVRPDCFLGRPKRSWGRPLAASHWFRGKGLALCNIVKPAEPTINQQEPSSNCHPMAGFDQWGSHAFSSNAWRPNSLVARCSSDTKDH